MILFDFVTGTCETAIHFVIYEHFKKMLRQHSEELSPLECTGAAGVAKFTASILCYPHGKVDKLSPDVVGLIRIEWGHLAFCGEP